MSNASVTLAAKFSVTRGGTTLCDKLLREESRWESSFVGAVSIPEAINR